MNTEHLSDQQIARVEALQAAQPLLGRHTRGAFSGSDPTEIDDLVDLSIFILEGKHPLDRYDGLEPQFSSEVLSGIGGDNGDPGMEGDTRDDTPHA